MSLLMFIIDGCISTEKKDEQMTSSSQQQVRIQLQNDIFSQHLYFRGKQWIFSQNQILWLNMMKINI
jgi:hypothetical protein